MTQNMAITAAQALLRRVRLDLFLDQFGRPTGECWERISEGSLSSSEKVMVALALAVIGYDVGTDAPRVTALMVLDADQLRTVAQVLMSLTEETSRTYGAAFR